MQKHSVSKGNNNNNKPCQIKILKTAKPCLVNFVYIRGTLKSRTFNFKDSLVTNDENKNVTNQLLIRFEVSNLSDLRKELEEFKKINENLLRTNFLVGKVNIEVSSQILHIAEG